MKKQHVVWVSFVVLLVGFLPAAAEGGGTLRVMSYNIGLGQDRPWGARGQKVMQHITNIHPRVIALQEARSVHSNCCYGQNDIEAGIPWVTNAPGAHNYFLDIALQQTDGFTFRNDSRPMPTSLLSGWDTNGFTYGFLSTTTGTFSGEILVINVHMPAASACSAEHKALYSKMKNEMFSDRFGSNPQWPVIIMGDFNSSINCALNELGTVFDVGAVYGGGGDVITGLDFILANSGSNSPSFDLTTIHDWNLTSSGGVGRVHKVFESPDLENNCPKNFATANYQEGYCASDHPPIYLDIVIP